MDAHLLRKYNVAGPRYTSYPTVPCWGATPTSTQWAHAVRATFQASNAAEGIALYVHLPYCESLCTYCACNTRITVNHAVETPYIDGLLAEWAMYRQIFDAAPQIRELHLGGGTPTFFSPDNLARLIDGLLEGAILHPRAEMSFEGHPANTTRAHLDTLWQRGFKRVSYGIQDYDPQVQLAINRKQSPAQVAETVEHARAAGYSSINFDLVYGLPFQNRAGLIKTVREVLRQRPDRIAFYGYAHVPWVKPGQRKFTEADLPPAEEKHALYRIGRDMLLDSGYQDVGMDHFALPGDALHRAAADGSLHRNFMGYTPEHTALLVGLGASAISDAWTAFAQNRKTVEDYLAEIHAGRLPFFKGHTLSHDDQVLRRHILNLMCKFRTSWAETGSHSPQIAPAIERLAGMEKDGLVRIVDQGVQVTRKGRPFVRNVCMAFDAHLHQSAPTGQVFSATV